MIASLFRNVDSTTRGALGVVIYARQMQALRQAAEALALDLDLPRDAFAAEVDSIQDKVFERVGEAARDAHRSAA